MTYVPPTPEESAAAEVLGRTRWRNYMSVAELRAYLDQWQETDILFFESEEFDPYGTEVYRAGQPIGYLAAEVR